MKTRYKIAMMLAALSIVAVAAVLATQYAHEVQRQEAFSRWKEIRESWLAGKDSEIQSFSGTNCSAQGTADLGCFFDAYERCLPAIIEQTQNTIEGDPISIIARTNPDCNVDLIYDSTMDRYSSQEIKQYTCYSVTLQENRLDFDPCSYGTSEEKHGFSIMS